ncbi:hypothetical protein L798_07520 [Zootermopsis nevadensis]|uniref:Uncharacterized protein n=1 Tax=Zootermopsis nevadensis TaxID=136037 RepID=A0A067R5T9_ZOONE|nr:hypothetical protein L798_07520 [Zootermopsis nevadensis]
MFINKKTNHSITSTTPRWRLVTIQGFKLRIHSPLDCSVISKIKLSINTLWKLNEMADGSY